MSMDTITATNQIPHVDPARREWVKFQLMLRGYSLTGLAAELGVTRNAVSNALGAPYPRMEHAIGQVLGIHPQYIWPERYDAAGKSNRRLGPVKRCVVRNTTPAMSQTQA